MKKFLILSLFLSAVFLLHAQEEDGFKFSDQGHNRAVRLSLIHFLDPIAPSAQATFEYRLRYNTYLRHEFGFFYDYGSSNNALENLNGFRFRTARRAFRWQNQLQQRFYWEIALDYKYTAADSRGDFRIIDNNGGTFNRSLPYTVNQHSFSINYNKGTLYDLGNNWQFDIGIGGGVRLNYRTGSALPINDNSRAIFNTNGDLLWRYENGREDLHFTVSMSVIAALGYQF